MTHTQTHTTTSRAASTVPKRAYFDLLFRLVVVLHNMHISNGNRTTIKRFDGVFHTSAAIRIGAVVSDGDNTLKTREKPVQVRKNDGVSRRDHDEYRRRCTRASQDSSASVWNEKNRKRRRACYARVQSGGKCSCGKSRRPSTVFFYLTFFVRNLVIASRLVPEKNKFPLNKKKIEHI